MDTFLSNVQRKDQDNFMSDNETDVGRADSESREGIGSDESDKGDKNGDVETDGADDADGTRSGRWLQETLEEGSLDETLRARHLKALGERRTYLSRFLIDSLLISVGY